MVTLDGKNTHHGLGSIAIANGNFADLSSVRKKIPRDKKEPWSAITGNTNSPVLWSRYSSSNKEELDSDQTGMNSTYRYSCPSYHVL